MTNNMAQGYGRWMRGMHDRVFSCPHFKRRKRCRIIRNLGRNRDFQRITSIGFCINEGAIDAFFIDRRAPRKIGDNSIFVNGNFGLDRYRRIKAIDR